MEILRIYLAIKYHPDQANRARIERLDAHLRSLGHETVCVVRDLEAWGARRFSAAELMRDAFRLLAGCDRVLIELSERGVGLGIEAGYAAAKGIPIHVVAAEGSEISETLRGIADSVQLYRDVGEIAVPEKMSKP